MLPSLHLPLPSVEGRPPFLQMDEGSSMVAVGDLAFYSQGLGDMRSAETAKQPGLQDEQAAPLTWAALSEFLSRDVQVFPRPPGGRKAWLEEF